MALQLSAECIVAQSVNHMNIGQGIEAEKASTVALHLQHVHGSIVYYDIFDGN